MARPLAMLSMTLAVSMKALQTALRGWDSTMDRAFAAANKGAAPQFAARRPLWLAEDDSK